SLSYLLAGALLTEFVFDWPGLGFLTYQALTDKDEPLVMAAGVMLVLMLVLGSLIADLLLAFLDPRIRVEGQRCSSGGRQQWRLTRPCLNPAARSWSSRAPGTPDPVGASGRSSNGTAPR